MPALPIALFVIGFLVSPAGFAQEDADSAAVAAISGVPSAAGTAQSGWRNQWGLGVIANPKFVGSEDYTVQPIPYLDFRYFDDKGTKYFANVPQGLGGYVYRSRDRRAGSFVSVGAAIAPGFNVRDDSIEGIEEVDLATEARLYLEGGGRRWVASATLAQDVGSGHEGAYLDLSVALRGRLGEGSGFYAVGPVLRLGDDTYKESFFSVSEAESEASGLPEFSADGGVERIGVQGLASLPLGNSKWRVTSILRVSSLMEDAADSPIVQDETQLFFLTSFTRPF
jgi:outer membrane scaffolding protein for murein synthesis (MipA/OmpV family)